MKHTPHLSSRQPHHASHLLGLLAAAWGATCWVLGSEPHTLAPGPTEVGHSVPVPAPEASLLSGGCSSVPSGSSPVLFSAVPLSLELDEPLRHPRCRQCHKFLSHFIFKYCPSSSSFPPLPLTSPPGFPGNTSLCASGAHAHLSKSGLAHHINPQGDFYFYYFNLIPFNSSHLLSGWREKG